MPDRHMQDTLDQILGEARKTNGRITGLEHEVFGDPQTGRRGLVAQARETGEVVQTVKVFIRVGKWLAMAFGAAAVTLLANLAQGALL